MPLQRHNALRQELETARRVRRGMTDVTTLHTLHHYISELEEELRRSQRSIMPGAPLNG